jgi:hypothetical protein
MSSQLLKDGFISCAKLTKENQKKQNYKIKKIENFNIGMHFMKNHIEDISVKTTDRKEFFFKNTKKINLPGTAHSFVQNQFLIKGRLKKDELYSSFKNFLKNTIKGTTELCHDLLKNDDLIDLVVKFCSNQSINICNLTFKIISSRL